MTKLQARTELVNKRTATEKFNLKSIAGISHDDLTVPWDNEKHQMNIKDAHARRSTLRKAGNALAERIGSRDATQQESEAMKLIYEMLTDFEIAFDEATEKEEIEKQFAHTGAKNMKNTNYNAEKCFEVWKDTNTGANIPVLAKNHNFSDHCRNDVEMTAPEYFGALAAGQDVNRIMGTLTTTSDPGGGYLVPESISSTLIDLMRSKNTVIQAGALTVPMPTQTVRICRVVSDPVATWVPENNLIPDDSGMQLGALELTATKLTTLVKASRELLNDASNSGQVIMDAIAVALAGELDRAALFGTGAGEPRGIFNDSDACEYSLGAAGANLTGYDDILQGVKAIITANGPLPDFAIMSPRTLIDYSLIKNGEGSPLQKPDIIKNLTFLDSTKVPVNQVQGGSGAVCSSIILGGFKNLVIGLRQNLEILVLKERYAEYGQIGFLATLRADICAYQSKAFCRIIGIKP